jgi:DNA-binding NarL/FixJ family response regulator
VTKTLLAVDDSATMRKALEITFSGEDFKVIGAEGRDAAAGKLSENPSVVLIDTVLGNGDGYALCKEVRGKLPRAAIILLSSRYSPYDATRGQDAGADDFCDKPFDTQQLIDKAKKAFATRQAGPGASAAPVAPQPTAAPAGPTAPTGATTGPGAAAPFSPRPPQASPAAPAQVPHVTTNPAAQPPQQAPALAAAARPPAVPAPQPSSPQAKPRAATLMFGAQSVVAPSGAPAAQGAQAATPQQRADTAPASVPTQASSGAPVSVRPPANVAHTPALGHAAARPATGTGPSMVSPGNVAVAAAVAGGMAQKLGEMGLSREQADAILALSREVVERVVWEVVPALAETIIREEIARLTKGA